MNISMLLKALGDPTRFRIYTCLLERKHCVRSLAGKLGISESAVSQHLKIMRQAELIYGEKYGYHTHYLPRQDTLNHLVDAFQELQAHGEALDRTGGDCQCPYRKETSK